MNQIERANNSAFLRRKCYELCQLKEKYCEGTFRAGSSTLSVVSCGLMAAVVQSSSHPSLPRSLFRVPLQSDKDLGTPQHTLIFPVLHWSAFWSDGILLTHFFPFFSPKVLKSIFSHRKLSSRHIFHLQSLYQSLPRCKREDKSMLWGKTRKEEQGKRRPCHYKANKEVPEKF